MEQKVVKQLDKKKVAIIAAVVVGALMVIYLGMSIYFMSHFHFGTKIGEVDVSGKSAASAEALLQKTLKEYVLTIQERDGKTDTIVGDAIDLSVEWNTKPENYIEKQNGFAWIVKVFQPDAYEIDGKIFWDAAKLDAEIAGLSALEDARQIPAVNANVSEYDAGKGYTLVPAILGTVVDLSAFKTNIESCIVSLDETLVMADGNSYVAPVIDDDNEKLLAVIAQLNKSLDVIITYQMGENTHTLDASTFQPWLYVNENLEACVQEDALQEYVKGLASNYNTYNSAKKFMTSYNQEITITNCHYGWKIDNGAECAAITSDILGGESVAREFNYAAKAHSYSANDYGNSYVEINLTAQHLFLYVDGKVVVETDFVSGNLSRDWDTPTGIWGLTYKTTKATLRGDGYATPVDYWMPYAGNVGMHDATWRNDFGGSIYKRDGSHGCVNLPWGKAKEIYGYIKKGFPVIVYNLAGTESPKGIAMDQAYAMDQAIQAIGTVTLESETAITTCRTQYDALNDVAKSYVKKYQILIDAEKALETLKVPAETEEVENIEEVVEEVVGE